MNGTTRALPFDCHLNSIGSYLGTTKITYCSTESYVGTTTITYGSIVSMHQLFYEIHIR